MTPDAPMEHRFEFAFDLVHRVLALPFGVTPGTAYVRVDDDRVVARFGPWRVEAELENIAGVVVTGPYWTPKTAGPARLSLKDRGLTLATNDAQGVCIQFRDPIPGIEPTGRIRHPALTVTVADSTRLAALLSGQVTSG